MAQPDDDELSLSASSMSGVDEDGEVPDEASSQQAAPCSRWDLSAADAAILVKVVKLAQKQHYCGRHGVWKDFLLVRCHLEAMHTVCERPTAFPETC